MKALCIVADDERGFTQAWRQLPLHARRPPHAASCHSEISTWEMSDEKTWRSGSY